MISFSEAQKILSLTVQFHFIFYRKYYHPLLVHYHSSPTCNPAFPLNPTLLYFLATTYNDSVVHNHHIPSSTSHVQSPLFGTFQKISPSTRSCATFRNKLTFMVMRCSPSPNPYTWTFPKGGCKRLLIQYMEVVPPSGTGGRAMRDRDLASNFPTC
jgi:hypothetical protein